MPKIKLTPHFFTTLIISLAISLGGGFVGGLITGNAIPTWYSTLNKPFFTPPGWLFAPAWTFLYICMSLAFTLVWESKLKKPLKYELGQIYVAQLVLNFTWSLLFFGLRSPLLGGLDILFLWALIFWFIKQSWKSARLSSYLFLPYLAWVSFATLLNWAVVILN